MRQTLQIMVMMVVVSVLPGCAPFVIAVGLVTLSTIQQESRKQAYARKIERERQERIRLEALEQERLRQNELARSRAEELRRRQDADAERRRREKQKRHLVWLAKRRQEDRDREQLSSLPDKANRHATSLADVRRELAEIVKDSIETKKLLLGAKLDSP